MYGMVCYGTEQPIVHPYLWWECDGWTLMSIPILCSNEPYKHTFNEVDVAVGKKHHLRALTIEASLQYYIYPGQADAPNTDDVHCDIHQ